MPAAAQASVPVTTLIPELVPLAVITLVFWALARWGHAPMWALLLTLILGVALSGTIAGPPIHQILSQLSGGRLH